MKIFFLSEFLKVEGIRHGGNERAAQVHELLAQCGDVIHVLQYRPRLLSNASSALSDRMDVVLRWIPIFLRGLNPSLPASLKRFKSLQGIKFAGLSDHLFSRMRKSGFGSQDILVLEAQLVCYYPLVAKARRRGAKVIIVPQNLDSLAPGYINPSTGENALDWFKWEIVKMKSATAAFCISREEQWLLRLWGIDAYYLPFYPIKKREEELHSIRAERNNASKDIFLVMGSALNSPTRIGMMQLANHLKNNDDWLKSVKIVVVGNGTEKLKEYFGGKAEVLGTVSDEVMIDLWIRSKACLIHQPPTTGSVTRIVELLIAGIPVIANSNAARSHFGIDGLHVYEDLAEISAGLLDNLACPLVPTVDENYFERFRSFVAATQTDEASNSMR